MCIRDRIKEARIIVEGTLIELAAGRISLAEIRGLRDLLKGMEASFNRADYERFLVLAEQFCQCIGKASGNRILAELVTGLRKSPTFEVETKGIRELLSLIHISRCPSSMLTLKSLLLH